VYKTIILSVVFYDCEPWPLVLREEQRRRLRLLENTMLRKILGSEGKNVTSGWRKISEEDLHDLYSSSNINRILK